MTDADTLKDLLEKHPEHRFEILHSPDEGGWYVVDWLKDRTSELLYSNKANAESALESDAIHWED